MPTLTVITADGVPHEYIDGDTAAIEYAKAAARSKPGRPVQLVGVGDDGTAVNATLTYTHADGITHVDNLARARR